MTEKLKENKCFVMFACTDAFQGSCVYFKESNNTNGCKYSRGAYCDCTVACVNRMILEMKSMGFISKGCFDGKSKEDLEKLIKEN